MSISEQFKNAYLSTKTDRMSVDEYLDLCKENKQVYETIAERMVRAIGEPILVDTSKDQRLARLFGNRIIKTYKAFEQFYGMEDTIEEIVSFFRHSSQGLEESKQLLYLLGPVGGGKSSLVEKVKELAEHIPFYTLGYFDKKGDLKICPYFASPLGLFNNHKMRKHVSETYDIEERYISNCVMGPWETKRLKEFDGDLTKFVVVKMHPSRQEQTCVANVEPGDENTQDISTLVGKVDIRKLEEYAQNDPDAYLFSGGLNATTQGIMDFREMFKAKPKMLHPLLFAVQEHNYQGVESFGALPYNGIVVAHSNEAEWETFRNNKNNEAFLDRVCIVKVPYCLRVDEEVKIYEKFIKNSSLKDAPVAPGTFKMLSQFAVLSRLNKPGNSTVLNKMRVYNGENLKETDQHASTYLEYRDIPENRKEGFFGISTRWASKRLSDTYNADSTEIAADPVYLLKILTEKVKESDLSKEDEENYISIIKTIIQPKYYEDLDKEIRTAYLESYAEYGQNLFERYITYADHWISENDFYDADTGESLDKDALDKWLEKIEKSASIVSTKDFRNEVVRFVMRYQTQHGGKYPDWRSYEKLREVIEKKMFSQTDDILPVISFNPKGTEEDKKKHLDFIERMKNRGYTEKQIRRLVEWYVRVGKSS